MREQGALDCLSLINVEHFGNIFSLSGSNKLKVGSLYAMSRSRDVLNDQSVDLELL